MRSIQAILRNLLIATAALVLFSSVSWAEGEKSEPSYGSYSAEVEACKAAVTKITSEAEIMKSQAEKAAYAQVAAKQQKKGKIVEGAQDQAVAHEGASNTAVAGVTSFAQFRDSCIGIAKAQCGNLEDKKPEDPEGKASATKAMTALVGSCVAAVDKKAEKLASTAYMTRQIKGGMSTVAKVAIGAGVIGGGLLLMDHIGDKKEKKKEKKEAEAKERASNGIIKDADGNDLACFSEQNYMRLECNAMMLSLCQAGKADTAGCKAFNSNYCASTGSGSNYCLYADSKTYCSQSGSMVASSPACQWANARSSECKSNPEQVSCLYSGSAEALTLACANYPSDPLCSAHTGGRIVVQGGGSATTTAATTTTESTGAGTTTTGTPAADYGDGSSVTMSSVISSDTTAATAADSTALASTDSMWTSSSSVASKACADGLLQNCSN